MTQEAALDEVIELAFEDEHLRLLLKPDGIMAIGLLRENQKLWYNMPKPIQCRAHRALIALADENASIKELIGSLQMARTQAWPQIKTMLKSCLW